MTRQAIINKTTQVIKQLPQDKAIEVSDFADFLAKKYETQLLLENIQTIVAKSGTFDFLHEEEDELYSLVDLKEKYHD